MTHRSEPASPLIFRWAEHCDPEVSYGLTAYQYTVIEMMKAVRSSASGSLGNGVPSDQVLAAAIKDADTAWDAFEKADAPPVAADGDGAP